MQGGGGSIIGVDPQGLKYTLGDFVTLWLIQRCAFGPLEASALGSKMSFPEGKVKGHCRQCFRTLRPLADYLFLTLHSHL